MSVLIVGEDNPHSRDPRLALFHLPRRASGNKLRMHLGLTDAQYVRIKKINLCPEKWSASVVTEVAKAILDREEYSHIILLGTKVKKAFCHKWLKFFNACACKSVLISLPHPSGRTRLWNDPTARQQAQDLLRHHCPEIYAT